MELILVVDDELSVRELIRRALAKKYSVLATPRLSEARRIIADYALDLIILDGNLPDGNGAELAEELAQERRTPVLFISTDPNLEPKGVTIYRKPFPSLVEFRAKVEEILKTHST